ncbi:MAG: phenylalanine--tRNA ligase subunit alpha [Firmicutes bacterium]|nr:phenylalanine--tRNA ligase subunit alpha [Bacillota bacterium]MBQ9972354.1 phenylalanine--tRNA ligase subunit alpha [Bacillota bacterium]
MQAELQKILAEALEAIAKASSVEECEETRVKFLGKKGALTEILKGMGKLSPEEKKEIGQVANKAKAEIENTLNARFAELKAAAQTAKLAAERIDVTEPGKKFELGAKHPLTVTMNEILNVFKSMGYSIVEGPEVETVWHNFDALNSPKNHPSRDMTDTFYFSEGRGSEDMILRTHTSPVEIRTMLSQKPPIKVVVPGRCFRNDTPDATHSPMFHQIEGLVVDEGITLADLKGTLDTFAKLMFGPDARIKFRPSHFPFTEPSAEIDVSCFKCGGKGCNVCKGSGWIEILGCGLTHPHVLQAGGIDPEKYSGFAFGMGVERVAMLKYGVEDIRLFYENDMRFISEFK